MAESHVESALVDKRAEISGIIARIEQQLGQFRGKVVHLDATLRTVYSGSHWVAGSSWLRSSSGLR